LDTRSKIISVQEARERLHDRPARWVSGHFDPLLAEHVRRLSRSAEAGQLLVVEVTDLAQPLLPQRARAELVAALAIVDYVVLGNGQLAAQGAGDADISERFIQHVLRRHREEAGR
jgi:bifunctional ADP-heptose synthase (sugar kinase/adenylyltransferase)